MIVLFGAGSSWFTTMVGRKVTLKGLSAKLWALGAATVRTTEFVQGRTSRWGLAWSFTPPPRAIKKNPVLSKSNHSFMLEVNFLFLSTQFLHGFSFYRFVLHVLLRTCPISCFRTFSATFIHSKVQLHTCKYSLVIAVSSAVPTRKALLKIICVSRALAGDVVQSTRCRL